MRTHPPTARPALVRSLAPVLAPVLATLLLAGCGNSTARTFGFTRDAPDEFQVTTRAPLSLPPSLGELPTPRPGAPRPNEQSPRQAAESALVPNQALAPRAGRAVRPSSAEASLLAQAGRPTNPDIRNRVDEESLKLDQPSRGLTDRLIFWREPEPPGVALDTRREAQRLRENSALGKDPSDGETPIVQRSQSSNPIKRLFESIF
jgi:hypothetical protein